MSELSDSSPKLTNTTSDHVKYVVYVTSDHVKYVVYVTSDHVKYVVYVTSDHVKYVVYVLSPQCGILLVYFIHYEIVHSENFVVRPRNLYLVVMLLFDLLIILF